MTAQGNECKLSVMKTELKITDELQNVHQQEIAARLVLVELAKRRRELMLRLWNGGKGLPYRRIGEIYGGISRARVEQMIKQARSETV